MLRGFWQKVVKALRAFVSWGLAGEGFRGWWVVLDWRETGRECSVFAKTAVDRKTACPVLLVLCQPDRRAGLDLRGAVFRSPDAREKRHYLVPHNKEDFFIII